MGVLADKNSNIVIQGITGREASMVTKHALDYGTNIVEGTNPGKKGDHPLFVTDLKNMKRGLYLNFDKSTDDSFRGFEPRQVVF